MPKISVIVPTYNRQKHYRNLVFGFLAQSWPNTELLICDDSETPSAYLQTLCDEHDNIIYRHMPSRMSIGAKRNALIQAASGEIIAQFDDDDYYAPHYLETLYREMAQQQLDFLTLSRWFSFSLPHNTFAYWETDWLAPTHCCLDLDGVSRISAEHFRPDFVEMSLWGFGFSYMFRRNIFETVQYGDINFGEDYDFYQRVADQGFKTGTMPDEKGLVLHLLHPNSTSRIFPQFLLPTGLLTIVFPSIGAYFDNLT